MKSKLLKKSAFDCAHVKSVSAYVLLHHGKVAGRIVANWSDNPAGSTVTATVHVYSGRLRLIPSTHGTAGGYGYCKLSAAICDALVRGLNNQVLHDAADIPVKWNRNELYATGGAGINSIRKWFAKFGYSLETVIGQ